MLDKRPEETDERCLKEVIKKTETGKSLSSKQISLWPQLQWPGWGSALLEVGRGCRVYYAGFWKQNWSQLIASCLSGLPCNSPTSCTISCVVLDSFEQFEIRIMHISWRWRGLESYQSASPGRSYWQFVIVHRCLHCVVSCLSIFVCPKLSGWACPPYWLLMKVIGNDLHWSVCSNFYTSEPCL